MADLKVKHCHFLMLFVTKHQDFCYISLPKAFAVFFFYHSFSILLKTVVCVGIASL